MEGLGMLACLFLVLFSLYLVIWFGVKNGVKTAINELDITLKSRDGCTVVIVKDREVPKVPEDDEILV